MKYQWFQANYFLHINKRLIEIFSCTDNKPFAGKPVILCGDLYQLPPVNARPIFIANNTYIEGILSVHLWRKFEITELTEIMRQKGDSRLIQLLNKVRVGNIDKDAETLLKSRFIQSTDPDYPFDALHIFAENVPAKDYNDMMLSKIKKTLNFYTSVR